MPCIFNGTLILWIVCEKCNNNDDTRFLKEEPIEILKIFGLIDNINE